MHLPAQSLGVTKAALEGVMLPRLGDDQVLALSRLPRTCSKETFAMGFEQRTPYWRPLGGFLGLHPVDDGNLRLGSYRFIRNI